MSPSAGGKRSAAAGAGIAAGRTVSVTSTLPWAKSEMAHWWPSSAAASCNRPCRSLPAANKERSRTPREKSSDKTALPDCGRRRSGGPSCKSIASKQEPLTLGKQFLPAALSRGFRQQEDTACRVAAVAKRRVACPSNLSVSLRRRQRATHPRKACFRLARTPRRCMGSPPP